MARGNSLIEQERLDQALLKAAQTLGSPRTPEEEAKGLGIFKDLLAKGANPNVESGSCVRPLHWVARGESKGMAKALWEAGADLNARDREGAGPLHWALRTHSLKMLSFLLGAGANPNPEPDTGGERPLDFAARSRYLEACEILIKAGARGLPNAKGETALHHAAGYAGASIIRLLATEGLCDLGALDENGKTALDRVEAYYGSYQRDEKIAFMKSPEARAMNVAGQARELEEVTSPAEASKRGPRI